MQVYTGYIIIHDSSVMADYTNHNVNIKMIYSKIHVVLVQLSNKPQKLVMKQRKQERNTST